MDVTQRALADGVDLVAVNTDKFKTSLLSVSLVAPLDAETATANALVGDVLYRGSEDHPDIEAISAAEDELYGLTLSPSVRQKGESQIVNFTASFIDDQYALDGQPVLEPAAQLVGEILLRPVTENGVFRSDYVKSEGANLADLIRSQINEKRAWSILRVTEVMCEGERYAVNKYGFADQAEQMDPAALWQRYQALLKEARVVFYYGGSASPDRVEQAIRAAFGPLLTPRSSAMPETQVIAAPKGAVREQTDRLDVAQGKLALGFRAGGVSVHSPLYPALMVCNAVYGAGASSKLFLNVREKLSLCYFASSMVDKLKGVMVVSSGVEFSNFQVAKDEILAQLEHVKNGDFTDEDLHIARQALCSALRTTLDSQARMEEFWFTQRLAGLDETPEELSARIAAVTREQVIEAARGIELDTVYYLTGKEA